jgi:hypothetical protein
MILRDTGYLCRIILIMIVSWQWTTRGSTSGTRDSISFKDDDNDEDEEEDEDGRGEGTTVLAILSLDVATFAFVRWSEDEVCSWWLEGWWARVCGGTCKCSTADTGSVKVHSCAWTNVQSAWSNGLPRNVDADPIKINLSFARESATLIRRQSSSNSPTLTEISW